MLFHQSTRLYGRYFGSLTGSLVILFCHICLIFHQCTEGSYEKQKWDNRPFNMEELWWLKWIFLVRLRKVYGWCYSPSLRSSFSKNTRWLNFRSPDCFEIGWPMRLDHDFFYTKPSNKRKKKKPRTSDKTHEEEKSNNNDDEEMGVSQLLNFIHSAIGFWLLH